ncbi:MAG: tetratricopeptide repeat protein, partial [Candidatus Hydrogenedentes bacterium]|nr:tetratricopeptide repeat protein [Candidatus Hydrogenedentota bacterium]
MARPRKNKPVVDHLLVHEEAKTEWQKALNHLEDNYKLYLAGAVFLLLCAAVGAFIRLNTAVKDQEASTAYAEAVLEEDAALRLEKYGDNMDVLGRWSPEALYRMGETAIEAEEYDRAEEIFTQFTATYPGNEYLPNVVDGLAFLAWNKGDLEAALQGFERVAQEWPGDFVGRRKYYDIGQVLEELDRLEDAIAAYKKQIVLFPESSVQRRSQQALDALKEEHPDLFPEEEGEEDIATEETAEVTGSEGEVVNVEAVAAEDTAADEPVLVVEEENIPVEEPVVSVEVSTDIPVTVEEPVV